jgi:hypothetical protein
MVLIDVSEAIAVKPVDVKALLRRQRPLPTGFEVARIMAGMEVAPPGTHQILARYVVCRQRLDEALQMSLKLPEDCEMAELLELNRLVATFHETCVRDLDWFRIHIARPGLAGVWWQ